MASQQLRVYAPYVGQRFLGLERVKTDIAGKRLDMISLVSRKAIGGRVLKPERVQVICPARRERGGSYGGSRQGYRAICAACGAETTVPFEPKQGRPAYCGDCYAKIRKLSEEG